MEVEKKVQSAVRPPGAVREALDINAQLKELEQYILRQGQKAAQSAETTMEEMLIIAIKSNAAPTVISAMQKRAGISDARLAELQEQAQHALP